MMLMLSMLGRFTEGTGQDGSGVHFTMRSRSHEQLIDSTTLAAVEIAEF